MLKRVEQQAALENLGLQNILWHGRVSYIAIKPDSEPCSGVVYFELNKVHVTQRPMKRFDYDILANYLKTNIGNH